MTTTYVFGAGASIHASYPPAYNMGEGLLEFMLSYPNDWFQASAQTLVETFGKSPNIEDLISDIEAKIDSLENAESFDEKFLRSKLNYARGHVAHVLREWFRVLHNSPAHLYASFADRIIEPGDTVITFNYDDSLDRELRRAGKWDLFRGYGFPFGNANTKSEVLMLKLHGSVNWMISLGGGAESGPVAIGPGGFLGSRPVIHTVDAEYLGYKDFSGYTFKGGGVSMDSLILPGRCKRFFIETSLGIEFKLFWDALWFQGTEAVKKTDRLVICGYSMPKADVRARELLLKDTNKAASVVVLSGSDSERIANDFRDAKYKNVEVLKRGYFEDLVESANSASSANS